MYTDWLPAVDEKVPLNVTKYVPGGIDWVSQVGPPVELLVAENE